MRVIYGVSRLQGEKSSPCGDNLGFRYRDGVGCGRLSGKSTEAENRHTHTRRGHKLQGCGEFVVTHELLSVELPTVVALAAMAMVVQHPQQQRPPPSASSSTSGAPAVPSWLQAQLHYVRTHSPIAFTVGLSSALGCGFLMEELVLREVLVVMISNLYATNGRLLRSSVRSC